MRDPGQSSSTVIAMSWPPASNASSPSHLRPLSNPHPLTAFVVEQNYQTM